MYTLQSLQPLKINTTSRPCLPPPIAVRQGIAALIFSQRISNVHADTLKFSQPPSFFCCGISV